MEDKRVTLVYFATVTFDGFSEVEYHTDKSMIEEALRNVGDNVRAATEYSAFDTRENFEAIVTTDDDIDHKTLQQLVAFELRKSYAPQKDVIKAIDEDGVLVASEFDLHDWITSLLHTDSMPDELVGPDGETHFNAVNINWQGYTPEGEEMNEFDPTLPTIKEREELESAYDDLILAIVKLDSLHHDICEYTC